MRLLPVAERAKALFGEDGARAAADWIESDTDGDLQTMLFPDMESTPKKEARGLGKKAILSDDAELHSPGATTLDKTLVGGLYPFIVGDLIKLYIAAVALPGAWALIGRRRS